MKESNKAMGHRRGNSSTYVAFDMPDFISADCPAIIVRSVRQIDPIERICRLHSDNPNNPGKVASTKTKIRQGRRTTGATRHQGSNILESFVDRAITT